MATLVNTHVCTRVYTHVYTHVHTHVCTHVYTHVYTRVRRQEREDERKPVAEVSIARYQVRAPARADICPEEPPVRRCRNPPTTCRDMSVVTNGRQVVASTSKEASDKGLRLHAGAAVKLSAIDIHMGIGMDMRARIRGTCAMAPSEGFPSGLLAKSTGTSLHVRWICRRRCRCMCLDHQTARKPQTNGFDLEAMSFANWLSSSQTPHTRTDTHAQANCKMNMLI